MNFFFFCIPRLNFHLRLTKTRFSLHVIKKSLRIFYNLTYILYNRHYFDIVVNSSVHIPTLVMKLVSLASNICNYKFPVRHCITTNNTGIREDLRKGPYNLKNQSGVRIHSANIQKQNKTERNVWTLKLCKGNVHLYCAISAKNAMDSLLLLLLILCRNRNEIMYRTLFVYV